MDLEEFKRFVKENNEWFQSEYKETVADISTYEERLGFSVPASMSWLLTKYGYSRACGVNNGVVKVTGCFLVWGLSSIWLGIPPSLLTIPGVLVRVLLFTRPFPTGILGTWVYLNW